MEGDRRGGGRAPGRRRARRARGPAMSAGWRGPGTGQKAQGGPARWGPRPDPAPEGAMPGGTAAASRRGAELPHRASQTPLSSTSADPVTYYDQPVVKKPVWTWEIPLYFLTGGVAGAPAPLAALSELAGNERLGQRPRGRPAPPIGRSPPSP